VYGYAPVPSVGREHVLWTMNIMCITAPVLRRGHVLVLGGGHVLVLGGGHVLDHEHHLA
jgi:hypothetical protein